MKTIRWFHVIGLLIFTNLTSWVLAAAPANNNFTNRISLGGSLVSTAGSNVEATKEFGEPDHAGNIGGKSVWWYWTADFDGLATIDTTGSGFDTVLAVYTGYPVDSLTLVAANDDNDTNVTSRVTFHAVAGYTYVIAVDGFNDGQAAASGAISLNVKLVPTNDNFKKRFALVGTSVSTTGTNQNATKETGEPNHAGYTGGHSVWWRWTAPYTGQARVDTIGSNFDTLLAVYTGTAVNSLVLVASDDQSGGNNTSLLTFNCTQGTTYQIAVDGWNGQVGNVVLHFPPVITNQPAPTGVTAGATAPFDFAITGSNLTFQWQESRNGQFGSYFNLLESYPYSGVYSLNLLVDTILTMNNYWYRCRISFQGGEVFTDAAQLTVNAPLITNQPQSTGVTAGATAPFDFQVNSSDINMQWQESRNGSGGTYNNLTNAFPYSGVTSLNLSVITDQTMTNYWYRCLVSFPGGQVFTDAVQLTVNARSPVYRGDFNGDSKSDILWSNTSNGDRYMWFMNGGTVATNLYFNNLPPAWVATTGDFNGDGKADLLWSNTSNGDRYMWLMNGGTITTNKFLGNIPTSWIVATADFNGDGKADLLWSNTSNGDRYMWLMNGGTISANSYLGNFAPAWTVAVGDCNGDGKSDLLWSNTVNGDRYLWFMNGATITTNKFLGTIPPAWTVITGDFNGDGMADLFWSSTANGDRYLWLMNGGTVTTNKYLGNIPTTWSVATGDFNGDGKSDLVWSSTANGDRYLWLMNGSTISSNLFLGTIATQWQIAK